MSTSLACRNNGNDKNRWYNKFLINNKQPRGDYAAAYCGSLMVRVEAFDFGSQGES